MNHPSTPSSP